jgi:hypothetical protein
LGTIDIGELRPIAFQLRDGLIRGGDRRRRSVCIHGVMSPSYGDGERDAGVERHNRRTNERTNSHCAPRSGWLKLTCATANWRLKGALAHPILRELRNEDKAFAVVAQSLVLKCATITALLRPLRTRSAGKVRNEKSLFCTKNGAVAL